MRLGILFSIPILLAALAASACCAQSQVQTSSGILAGSAENGVFAFKGIPFAAPPVGNLRWREPQPFTPWAGVRKATEFGASCMQPTPGERLPWTREFMVQNRINEDCLFLNVWTPRTGAEAKLPVIVYIHGGGFTEGSGAIDVYRGANLAAKGAVVVTVNYRLGVFGFLAHPELTAESKHHASGNYGLLDLVAALRWITGNIAHFGGDPHNVTIWGQSAGAFAVGALVASPLGAGIFQHAQADSGLGMGSLAMPKLSDAEQAGLRFARAHNAASLQQLRALPAAALLPNSATPATAGAAPPLRFGLILDGWALPDTPQNMNAAGTDNDVPVITGFIAGDPLMASGAPAKTLAEYHQRNEKRYGEFTAEFEKLYPVQKVEDITATTTESGQDRTRVSEFLWASARAKSHRQPVFIYFFDRAIPWPQHPEYGAYHSFELPYFFLNLQALNRPWDRVDHDLASASSSYLLNFAARGNPGGPTLPPWPKVDPNTRQTMELGAHLGPIPLASAAKIDFWTRYFNSPVSQNGSPF